VGDDLEANTLSGRDKVADGGPKRRIPLVDCWIAVLSARAA